MIETSSDTSGDGKSGDDKPATPSLGEPGQARAKQRETRRAAALRANLSRRKSQSRVRQTLDPELADSTPLTIYVYLLDEGTEVWRPVEAAHQGGDLYKIMSEEPKEDTWQFKTGDVVRCELKSLSEGPCLVAVELQPS